MENLLIMLCAVQLAMSISPETCYDSIALENIEIESYLAEDPAENIVLKIEDDNTPVCTKRSTIKRQISAGNTASICKKSTDDYKEVGRYLSEFWNSREMVFYLHSISQVIGAVLQREVEGMIQERSKQVFEISRNGRTSPLFGKQAYDSGDFTGANHCDPSHKLPMYNIPASSESNPDRDNNNSRNNNISRDNNSRNKNISSRNQATSYSMTLGLIALVLHFIL
jgi:hypothetical protein